MLAKWVTCIVPPDSRDAFSAAQRQWSVISDQPGLIGQLGGWDTTAGHAHILGLCPDQPRLTPTEDRPREPQAGGSSLHSRQAQHDDSSDD